ncbi:hypothetical protein CDL12_07530 [Handroanthus impetiginosus]|uniref:KIB1-4 beta-propeller domain-containing protein n=1 Tax=Handroanthus impetiginosus TaxID=429701 RepID=A0A2G9HQJ3_9LAMI|nr:hypothetical protein CDL12_07530 [Handroanthus impetiginosus]
MGKDSENSFSCLPKDLDQTHPRPWLLVTHGESYQNHSFYNISKDKYIKRNIPEFRHKQVSATSYGWLLLIDYTRKPLNCCLVNTRSKERIELPYIDLESESNSPGSWFYECILSKSPTDPDCHVLLIASLGEFLLFCRIGDEKFIKRGFRFGDDALGTATNFKGKIYAWMCVGHNLVEVDFVNEDILLKQLVNDRGQLCQTPEASPANLLGCVGYLVESCGELLLLHAIGCNLSGEVAYFRIFKIKTNERECEELKSIGDHAIFICPFGNMSWSCTDNSGLKKNSIYYTQFSGDVYVYDIEDRSRTLIKPCCTKSGIRPPLKSWIVL